MRRIPTWLGYTIVGAAALLALLDVGFAEWRMLPDDAVVAALGAVLVLLGRWLRRRESLA